MLTVPDPSLPAPSLPPLLTMRQLCALVPLSPTQIYRLVKAGTFPPQVRLSANRVAWRQDDIEHWLESGCRLNGSSRAAL